MANLPKKGFSVAERRKAKSGSTSQETTGAEQESKKVPEERSPAMRKLEKASAKPNTAPASSLLLDDSGDEDDDEIIQQSLQSKKSGKNKMAFAVGGTVVVVMVAVLFLLFSGKNDPAPAPPSPSVGDSEPVADATPSGPGPSGVGTQDFTQNTTMESDSPLTDPNDFVKDLYGLTLNANYVVSEIQAAADFVSYTKRRGTWGGGLELYYLDVEYNGYPYVIQVPFQYYKELDDTGIIPVKMEILRISSETSSDYLTVVSYMCLDRATLEQILKSQGK